MGGGGGGESTANSFHFPFLPKQSPESKQKSNSLLGPTVHPFPSTVLGRKSEGREEGVDGKGGRYIPIGVVVQRLQYSLYGERLLLFPSGCGLINILERRSGFANSGFTTHWTPDPVI